MRESYEEALSYAQKWHQTKSAPSADSYMLIAQSHYMLQDYESALPFIQKGINRYREFGSSPKEGWLNLLQFTYKKLDRHEEAISVIQEILKLYPEEEYRRQLAEAYRVVGLPKE